MGLTWNKDGNNVWHGQGTDADDIVTPATEGPNVLTNFNFVHLEGGNDLVDLGFGWDGAFGGSGKDTISGGWGEDTIYGGTEADLLYGGDDNDVLFGGHGADAMYGGRGSDILSGGEADGLWDNFAGGDGHDTYAIYDRFDVITDEAAYATATSRDKIELFMNEFNMNATFETRAIEDLTVMITQNTRITGNMLDNTITGHDGYDTINGDYGNDLIRGGRGYDSLMGGLGNDTVYGEGNADFVSGGNGNDLLYGGDSADNLSGGNQNDTIYGGEGYDSLGGGDGDDLLYGDDTGEPGGNDLLFGGNGHDTLYGGDFDDTMEGGDGNDRLYGGRGADWMKGGLGNDLYWVTDNGDSVKELDGEGNDVVYTTLAETNLVQFGEVETVTYKGAAVAITMTGFDRDDILSAETAGSAVLSGGAGNDTLSGSAGNDLIYGGTQNDLIFGQGGNDTLWGGQGFDTMAGGTGNDVYRDVTAQDTIGEDAGGGYDIVYVDGTGVKLAANVEEGRMQGGVIQSLSGNDQANTLVGNDFSGYALHGNGGDDRLYGGAGSESLYGGNGNDTLVGNAGNDVLMGGSGNDLMQGGAGNDIYYVDSTLDKVVESIFGNGIDTVKTSLSAYTLAGDIENLTNLSAAGFTGTGNALANELRGSAGADTMMGLGGNDKIYGGGGADKIWGGAGNDEFHFSSIQSINGARVYDFVQGQDKLMLDTAGAWSASWVDADTTRLVSNSGDTILVDGFDVAHAWANIVLL